MKTSKLESGLYLLFEGTIYLYPSDKEIDARTREIKFLKKLPRPESDDEEVFENIKDSHEHFHYSDNVIKENNKVFTAYWIYPNALRTTFLIKIGDES